jgi:hypothetical protein
VREPDDLATRCTDPAVTRAWRCPRVASSTSPRPCKRSTWRCIPACRSLRSPRRRQPRSGFTRGPYDRSDPLPVAPRGLSRAKLGFDADTVWQDPSNDAICALRPARRGAWYRDGANIDRTAQRRDRRRVRLRIVPSPARPRIIPRESPGPPLLRVALHPTLFIAATAWSRGKSPVWTQLES